MENETLADPPAFRLFSSSKTSVSSNLTPVAVDPPSIPTPVTSERRNPIAEAHTTFAGLGLSKWATEVCKELGLKRPTPVQTHCIPRILAGEDVMGIAQTGSGKTAAFALPILQKLEKDPFGVFALVITPTRELASQLAEQFRALGSSLPVKCAVIVGGMDATTQAKALMDRPHVVVATPGRITSLLQNDPDLPDIFARTKVIYGVGFSSCSLFNIISKLFYLLLFFEI